MSDETKTLTFESLIADLSPETKQRLRSEFSNLSENGRDSFNQLFALAYEQGKVDGASHVQGMIEKAKRAMWKAVIR